MTSRKSDPDDLVVGTSKSKSSAQSDPTTVLLNENHKLRKMIEEQDRTFRAKID